MHALTNLIFPRKAHINCIYLLSKQDVPGLFSWEIVFSPSLMIVDHLILRKEHVNRHSDTFLGIE